MFSNQKSKISIILPTFNSENYVKNTLQSILSQNYKNYELIIIDNISTDNTINIINSYKKKIKLKIIQKKTKNLAEALNIGINESSGEFIARIDADDLVRKKRFSKRVAFLERNTDYDIVGTNAFRFKNNIIFVKPFLINYDDILLKISMIFNSPFIHPSIMIRKKFIDNNNINYNDKFDECEDYELWLKLSPHINVLMLEDVLGTYVQREGNITSGSIIPKYKNIYKIAWSYSHYTNNFGIIKKMVLISLRFFRDSVNKCFT